MTENETAADGKWDGGGPKMGRNGYKMGRKRTEKGWRQTDNGTEANGKWDGSGREIPPFKMGRKRTEDGTEAVG